MPKAIGLVFKYLNDVYYTTNLSDLNLALGDVVIARTVRSKEIGRVLHLRDKSPSSDKDPFVRKVLRKATEKDFQREQTNRERENKAFSIAEKKIEKLGLPMTLIRVHYLFDHSRILFYFKAAGKVDFRQLVRELASVFKARIELRQIGVRDEAKMLGGIGACGRVLCCTSWLRSFAPVTVRMAKDQHLSLNPNKISGLCGRLQCCLEYEQKFYEDTLKGVPNMGSLVTTPEGDGRLIKANIFSGQGTIILEDSTFAQVALTDIQKRQRSHGGSRHRGNDCERQNHCNHACRAKQTSEPAKTADAKSSETPQKIPAKPPLDNVLKDTDRPPSPGAKEGEQQQRNIRRRGRRRGRRRRPESEAHGSSERSPRPQPVNTQKPTPPERP